MSIFIMISPFLGLVKLLPAEILSQSMRLPSVVALSLHFVFGIFFAFFYTQICFLKYKIDNIWLKGIAFGFTAFVISQILIGFLNIFYQTPLIEVSKLMITISNILGHFLFGIVVVWIVGDSYNHCKA